MQISVRLFASLQPEGSDVGDTVCHTKKTHSSLVNL